MPKRNYSYEKRQKELSRERKKEEKLQRKLDRANVRAENPEAVEPEPLANDAPDA